MDQVFIPFLNQTFILKFLEELLQPLKSIHQNCIFTSPTPVQEAIAQCFEKEMELIEGGRTEDSYLMTGLSSQLEALRDRLVKSCSEAGLKPIIPQAGYFLMADFDHFGKDTYTVFLHSCINVYFQMDPSKMHSVPAIY